MPRYSDTWVLEKAHFEYINGGDCACCSFPIFHPDGLRGLISSVSDLETDQANAEIGAAQDMPWPSEMRDQVWADRVRLRHHMKKEMSVYKTFMAETVVDAIGSSSVDDPKDLLRQWCIKHLGGQGLRMLFQMPRSEVVEKLVDQYKIQRHSPLTIVMTSVIEQVANFPKTKYETDSRGAEEIEFERMLKFDRRGGFILDIARRDIDQGEVTWTVNEKVLNMFIDVIVSLGGPKLLHRAPKTIDNDGDADGADPDAFKSSTSKRKYEPSFRGDRRMIRLIICRFWADQLIQKFKDV